MMVTQLAGKKDMRYNCMYCHDDIAGRPWLSENHHNIQYKVIVCKCGKKNWIRVNFLTSGHDNWHNDKRWLSIKEVKQIKKEFNHILEDLIEKNNK